MRGSAHPVVVKEDDYAPGVVLRAATGAAHALTVRRSRITKADPEVAALWGDIPGYCARLYLRAAAPCTIVQNGKEIVVPPRALHETTFREVGEPCLWPIEYPIDVVRFELPETALAQWSEARPRGGKRRLNLASGASVNDNTFLAFGHAAIDSLKRPARASQFFIDHMLAGVCAYMFDAFGDEPGKTHGGLAPWQERRAKALIYSRLGSDLSLEEMARECGLSVSHFARAFKHSVGVTPYRWMMRQRVGSAERLLIESDKPIVQIAAECGFADQAHLTSVFANHFGAPPGAYRREHAIRRRANDE